jgi:phosphatidylinositol-3-phosphatase
LFQISSISTKSIPNKDDKAIPKYDHIFVIIEENKAYNQIIGSPNAPIINKLAKTYGAATNFYAEVHPSEANYIAILGGDTFGIHDDDAFFCEPNSTKRFCKRSVKSGYVDHTVRAKSLMEQLESKGLTWKGYFEDIPSPGSKEIVSTGKIPWLYAVKHNGFMNFKKVQDDPKIKQKIVGFDQLAAEPM